MRRSGQTDWINELYWISTFKSVEVLILRLVPNRIPAHESPKGRLVVTCAIEHQIRLRVQLASLEQDVVPLRGHRRADVVGGKPLPIGPRSSVHRRLSVGRVLVAFDDGSCPVGEGFDVVVPALEVPGGVGGGSPFADHGDGFVDVSRALYDFPTPRRFWPVQVPVLAGLGPGAWNWSAGHALKIGSAQDSGGPIGPGARSDRSGPAGAPTLRSKAGAASPSAAPGAGAGGRSRACPAPTPPLERGRRQAGPWPGTLGLMALLCPKAGHLPEASARSRRRREAGTNAAIRSTSRHAPPTRMGRMG